MHLQEWVRKRGRGAISRLWRESGVSYSTVYEALRSAPISRYQVAKAISDATGGEVSVEELVSPADPTEPTWKRVKRGKDTHKPTRSRKGSSPGAGQ